MPTLTRTTLRLPSDLHRRLKLTAASLRTTSEAILIEALSRELDRRGAAAVRAIAIPGSMNTLMAELFLQSMPAFALIKDNIGRIIWVNTYTERTLKLSLKEIVGSRITELGFTNGIQKETIEANIQRVLRDGQPLPSKEGMNLTGVGKVTVRAHRYLVDRTLCDISFVEDEISEASFPTIDDAAQRMQQTVLEPAIERQLLLLLEAAPVAIAVKRPVTDDSIILWGNRAYLDLIRRSAEETFGYTTRTVLNLSHDHPIIVHETDIVRTGRARMAKEQFHDHAPRWSLRFPIYDREGGIPLIGVVSPHFEQSDESSR